MTYETFFIALLSFISALLTLYVIINRKPEFEVFRGYSLCCHDSDEFKWLHARLKAVKEETGKPVPMREVEDILMKRYKDK